MKQVLQDLRGGRIEVADVPAPGAQPGFVVLRNAASLISSGTERAAVELGQRSLLGKAVDRPDLVRKVLNAARTRGLRDTVRAVAERLSERRPLGYSCAGTVLEVGTGVSGLEPGRLVACAGFGYASHAEVVAVPRNLVVPVPPGVTPDHAAFVAVGAIALHGLRTAAPSIGDHVVVIGLGLVGLLSVQLLKAAGCRVIGVDLSVARCALARELGADHVLPAHEDAAARIAELTDDRGVDVALVTAATKSNEPLHLAADAARDRARICVVGDVGMDVPRELYYRKELELRVSRSYGPGRYDPLYETKGVEYPVGYVRWTERGNMSEFLRLLAAGAVRVEPLIESRQPIEQATAAYKTLVDGQLAHGVALVLTYATEPAFERSIQIGTVRHRRGAQGVSFIGAGAFARTVLLPRFRQQGVALRGVVTLTGSTARSAADRFGFAFCGTDPTAVLDDAATDIIVIATRHNTHAELARLALGAGKHVFLEKPAALNRGELSELIAVAERAPGILMVGYNRRFAPLAAQLKGDVAQRGPLAIVYRVNAGTVPPEHWIRDPVVGGGRIVGEACHFVDFARYLIGAPPREVTAYTIGTTDRGPPDSASFQVAFRDGSVAAIHYVALGDSALPKEYVEAFTPSGAAVLDDFTTLEVYRESRRTQRTLRHQDKGHDDEVRSFLAVCRAGGPPPIPIEELASTSIVTFAVGESIRTGRPATVDRSTDFAGPMEDTAPSLSRP